MSLGMEILLGLWYLAVLSGSAELIAKGAEILQHKFGVGFVGSVILGFITTLPELVFVMVAINENKPDVALGSAIGGNILLFTIGYGFVILLAYHVHKRFIPLPSTMRDDLIYLIISCFYILIASMDGHLDLFDGIVLSVLYVIFVIHQWVEAKAIASGKIKVTFPDGEVEEDEEEGEGEEVTSKDYYKSIALFLVGAVLLMYAAEKFVHSIIVISAEMGISALILALVVSPFASEMPEKISAFVLTTKSMKGAEMAIANFIGSKVQNNTLLFGGMILLNEYQRGPIAVSNDIMMLFVMVAATLVGVQLTLDRKLHLRDGIIAIIAYALTITFVLLDRIELALVSFGIIFVVNIYLDKKAEAE